MSQYVFLEAVGGLFGVELPQFGSFLASTSAARTGPNNDVLWLRMVVI